jgi:hypothetical protein
MIVGGLTPVMQGTLAVPVIAPLSDSRTVNVIDGDRAPSTHSQWMGIQRYTGETVDQIVDLNPTEVAYHADGTTPWVGRVGNEYVTTLKQGQTTFDSDTTRAEYYGPNTTPAPVSEAVDENYANPYWFAVDFKVGSDITSNTGVQSWTGPNVMQMGGTHNITWPGFTNSSGRDMAFFLNGGMLQFIITPPGPGPGLVYDVRTTPFSTTVVDTYTSGGDSGDERIWRLLDLVADQQTKIIIKVKMDNGDNGSANPRTEVWTKQGNGPLVKRIDHSGPNTFSNGLRYWKTGLYSFSGENIPAWWGDKNTRTIKWRSNLVMRGADGVSATEPTLDENVILGWLER